MKTLVVASTKAEKRLKLSNLLKAVNRFSFVSASSLAEIASIVSLQKEGVIVVASMNIPALSELDRMLPTGWDIIAILPSGMPRPFYSSSLTVLHTPVNKIEFSEIIDTLMSDSVFKKTEYGEDKDEIILKAKKKIMKEKNADENSAHRYLQKKSMESGKSLLETAKEILGQ